MNVRQMSVNGSFYPGKEGEIISMIEQFNTILKNEPEIYSRLKQLRGSAVIVPHAGWVYSGFTANMAYKALSNASFEQIIVIGPSHRVGFDGISICETDSYETPLGNIPTDQYLTHELKKRFSLSYLPQAHQEHSTEVQFPFIKHYFPDVKMVEMVYAYTHPSTLAPIMEYIFGLKNVAVVVSTDLSHYYPLSQAKKLDSICLKAIETQNTDLLHEGCEACGAIGVEAILSLSDKLHLESQILDYRTSADAFGDSSRVVGYTSALFTQRG